MTQTTLTMAGHTAHAGAARPAAAPGALSATHVSALPAAARVATKGGYGTHQDSTWTTGAIAKPATFMVLDRKNRPIRHLSELSP
jgi:hypothetical protein